LAEADSIIANEQLRKAEESARKAEEAVKAPTVEAETTTPAVESNLTTTQWLRVVSIIISAAGIYYKREEIKKSFAKAKAVMAPTPPVDVNVDVKTPIKRSGIRPMA